MRDEQRAQRVAAGRIGGAESARVRSAKAALKKASAIDAVVAAEREACAKIAEGMRMKGDTVPTEEAYNIACSEIAAAIRARGSK